ncbi:TPA: hypothetical protein L5A09_006690 [Pseudomonas aeruginosa]|nr:hypothetical protein [Pseudomonas aeruginosa]
MSQSKLPTTLRAYAEQRAAQAKEDESVQPLGRPRVFSESPLNILVYPERNIRPINPETIAEYKAAFLRGDKFPAIDVSIENGLVVLEHGYHRTLAAQEAMREKPVEMADLQLELREFKGNDFDRIVMMLNAQNSLDVDPVSRAEAYRALLNLSPSMTITKIADRLGKSGEHVSQQLLLVEADEKVKQLIREKKVSPTAVIQLIEEEKQGGKKHGLVVEEMVRNATAAGKVKATLKHRGAKPAGNKLRIGEVRSSLKSLSAISGSLRDALGSAKESANEAEADSVMVDVSLPASKVAELLALLEAQEVQEPANTTDGQEKAEE